jgi:uncharacterized membrane protein
LMNQQICWISRPLSGWKTTFRTGLPHYSSCLMIAISLIRCQQIFWISIHNVLMHTGQSETFELSEVHILNLFIYNFNFILHVCVCYKLQIR